MLTRSLVLLVCQFRHFRISHFIGNFQCGRWDLNPHERNAHKILSLARLPVPTLPHDRISLGFFIFSLATSDSIAKWILYVNTFFQKFSIFSVFLLFCHDYLWSGTLCTEEFFVCTYPGSRYFKSAIGANSFKCIGSGLRCRKLCAEDRYIGEFTAAVEGFRTYCHYIRSDFHCCQLLRSGHCRGANGCYTKALSTNLYCRRDRKGLSCCLVRSSGKDYGSLAGCVCIGYLIFQSADCIDRIFLNRDPEFFCNRTVIFSFSFDRNGCSSDIFIILPGKGVIPSVYKLLTAIGYGECLGQWLSGKGPGLKCGYLCFADCYNVFLMPFHQYS